MPTPRQLRAAAEKKERSAQLLLAEARALRGAADQLEQLSRQTPLTTDRDSTTIEGMPAIDSADFVRGVSRSKHRDHPWLKAMYEHKDQKKRLTVTAWALANGYKPGSAASWLSGKRIPLSAAKKIEAQYGVRATLRNWPNGIFADT